MVDQNIPWVTDNVNAWDADKNTFQQQPNTEFIASLTQALQAKKLDKNSPIILMCRSGHRSAAATNKLASEGFTQVYTLAEGFEGDKAKEGADKGKRTTNGWKNAGLPWNYTLDKDKLPLPKL